MTIITHYEAEDGSLWKSERACFRHERLIDQESKISTGELLKQATEMRDLLVRIQEWADIHHRAERNAVLQAGSALKNDIDKMVAKVRGLGK